MHTLFRVARVAVVVIVASCGGASTGATLPTPISTSLAGVSDHVGDRVTVEGYLTTDSAIHCNDGCWLWITEAPIDDDGVTYGDPPGAFAHVVIPEDTGMTYPSTIRDVPLQWEPSDVIVTSADGGDIRLNDRVRVTGWVEERSGTAVITGPRPCEELRPEDRQASYEARACADSGFSIVLLDS